MVYHHDNNRLSKQCHQVSKNRKTVETNLFCLWYAKLYHDYRGNTLKHWVGTKILSQFSLIGKKLDMLGTFFLFTTSCLHHCTSSIIIWSFWEILITETIILYIYIENKKLDQTCIVSCERKMGLNFDSNS